MRSEVFQEVVMHSKVIHRQGQKTFVLVFDKEDEVIEELTRFAKLQKLDASHFTAIGAFRSAMLGFFDKERKDYKKIPINEQAEVLSVVGDIARAGDEPKVHAHVVLGKADGTAWGGHLLEARVWPTLEVILTEAPSHLRRRPDAETGLALIDLSSAEDL
jgi:predicted DNA-binding protein with PD1-like motif